MILGVAILIVIGLLVAAIILVPDLLAWIISIGIWLLILVAILAVVIAIVAFLLILGVSVFYLARRTPPQGPEASYSLDMVKEPPKGNI
jgi:predicted ferric reductase